MDCTRRKSSNNDLKHQSINRISKKSSLTRIEFQGAGLADDAGFAVAFAVHKVALAVIKVLMATVWTGGNGTIWSRPIANARAFAPDEIIVKRRYYVVLCLGASSHL